VAAVRELVIEMARLRHALRALLAANEAISHAEGLTPQQYQAMLAICAWRGPMALKDLADQLMLKHSAAVQLFRRLETTGFVRREVSAVDRRVVHVKLTAAGDELVVAILQKQLREFQDRGEGLCRLIKRVQS
jgi:DNA-binding MarR family transcriptional regulator